MTEPLTRPQFIIAMAVRIGVVWKLHAKEAIPLAREAYRDFITEVPQQAHGHPEWSWTRSAAEEIAEEYVLAYGEQRL